MYDLLLTLQRHDHLTRPAVLPKNGIYVFFERGEFVQFGDRLVDRIVRVGTHRKDDRFPARIRDHYGGFRSLSGNKNSSIFRKHVGGALIAQRDPHDPRLTQWLKQNAPTYLELEREVSEYFLHNFTFVCFHVEDSGVRLALESGLIALFSQYPIGTPSDKWLGRYANSDIIRRTGLWNTQRVTANPLTQREFQLFQSLVAN